MKNRVEELESHHDTTCTIKTECARVLSLKRRITIKQAQRMQMDMLRDIAPWSARMARIFPERLVFTEGSMWPTGIFSPEAQELRASYQQMIDLITDSYKQEFAKCEIIEDPQ